MASPAPGQRQAPKRLAAGRSEGSLSEDLRRVRADDRRVRSGRGLADGGKHSCHRPGSARISKWQLRSCLSPGSAGRSTEDSQDPTISLPRQLRTPVTRSRTGSSSSPISTTWSQAARTSTNAAPAGPTSNSTSPSRATAASRTCSPRPPGPTAVSWRLSPSRSSGSPAAPISAPRSSTSSNKAESRCSPPTSPSGPAPRAHGAGGHETRHPGAHPAGQAGDRRVVRHPDARTVLGRLLRAIPSRAGTLASPATGTPRTRNPTRSRPAVPRERPRPG